MTRKEKVIYLAGIFDGEGCVAMYCTRSKKDPRKPHYQLLMRVTQKNPLACELLHEVFGGQLYSVADTGPKKPGPFFMWRVTDRMAEATLKELLPYLREKRLQAEVALEFQELRKEQRKITRISGLTDEMVEQRKRYVDKMKLLKRSVWDLNYFKGDLT